MRGSNWQSSVGAAAVLVAVVVVLAGAATPAAAQQDGEAPAVTLSSADIRVDGGEESTVTATYEFAVESTGSGDAALTAVSGTMWRFPANDIGAIAATVDGGEVSPEVTRESRFLTLSVPLEDVSAGDTVTVELTYTVAGAAGDLKVPLWSPEFQTTGESRVVSLTTTLPEDTQPQGATFPSIDDRDGNVLSSQMAHVPGFVSVPYGSGSGPLFSLDVVSTLVGVVIIFGFFGLWGAWTRGYIGKGGEADVA